MMGRALLLVSAATAVSCRSASRETPEAQVQVLVDRGGGAQVDTGANAAALEAVQKVRLPLLARLSAQGSNGQAPASGPVATAAIRVAGVDCEACAAPIRRALVGAGGFNDLTLDVPRKMVTVSYVPGPGRPDVYLKAIDDLGYEAKLSSIESAKKDPQ